MCRYGADLSDDDLRERAREEMVTRMQAQLKEEGVDVNGVTGGSRAVTCPIMLCFHCNNYHYDTYSRSLTVLYITLEVMEEMSRRNRELFKLPAYVLYVSRAFSTLEGIGLQIDPDYSMVRECYPYLSRRLMTDDSPRAKEALRAMLLSNSSVLSPAKLAEMTNGFASYTSFTANADAGGAGKKAAQVELAKLFLLATENDNGVVQEIVIEGVAKSADALIRQGVQQFTRLPPVKQIKRAVKLPHDLALRLAPPALAAPFTLPYDILRSFETLLSTTEEDEQIVESIDANVKRFLASNNTSTQDGRPESQSAVSTGSSSTPAASTIPNLATLRQPLNQLASDLRDPSSLVRTVLADSQLRKALPSAFARTAQKLSVQLLARAADRIDAARAESAGTRVTGRVSANDLNENVLSSVRSALSSTTRGLLGIIASGDKRST